MWFKEHCHSPHKIIAYSRARESNNVNNVLQVLKIKTIRYQAFTFSNWSVSQTQTANECKDANAICKKNKQTNKNHTKPTKQKKKSKQLGCNTLESHTEKSIYDSCSICNLDFYYRALKVANYLLLNLSAHSLGIEYVHALNIVLGFFTSETSLNSQT